MISRNAEQIDPVCILKALSAPRIVHAFDDPVVFLQKLPQERVPFLRIAFRAVAERRAVPLQRVEIILGDAELRGELFGQKRLSVFKSR